ncbi:MAG: ABC transporter ATP-binding protein [Acidobacteriia bacterium]|nr:ABC transporter ATP-binding protein [Terriglobia bacterium]
MANTTIHCEALGKRYRIGERPTLMLREALMKRLRAPFGRRTPPAKGNGDGTIWALRDVSFEIGEGEVVGIIGRNGAGKSTLLKVLSRITEPTTGRAEVRGRVGSLLEVGTGFHPELTGRDNIFLNGAILGMRKAEIQGKFDEIVAFAEIEKFLDTPVKHYSSGMYVRLAFAVAAHLDPEILLVDEVLAVGDAPFQAKCFDRLRKVNQTGRTILFVSHNMAALREVCRRGIVLQGGALLADGEMNEVADRYLASVQRDDEHLTEAETPNFILREARISAVDKGLIKPFSPVEIRVRLTAKTTISDPGVYIAILTSRRERLAGIRSRDLWSMERVEAGRTVEVSFTLADLPLLPGSYLLEVHLQDYGGAKFEPVPGLLPFEVAPMPVYGTRRPDTWTAHLALQARDFHVDAVGGE